MFQQNNPYVNQQAFGGYGYAQQQPINMSQPLSKEEMAVLKQKPGMQIKLSEEEMLKSVCTHKNETGITLSPNNDGSSTCAICGETFTLVDMDQDAVDDNVQMMKNILHTIKTYYIDIPVDTARNYFPIIPLLDRVPKLYKVAQDRFSKYEQGNNIQQNSTPYGMGVLGMIASPAMAPWAQQQQMMPQPQFAQPQFGQQPMMQQPQFAQQQQFAQPPVMQQQYGQAPMGNPFVQGGSFQQPQQPQYNVQFGQSPVQQGQPVVQQQQVAQNPNPAVSNKAFKD